MKLKLWGFLAFVPALLAVCGCNRHNAPSDQLAESAKKLVGAQTPEPAPLAAGRYAPRDTCHDLPGADAFRAKLADAVMARDTNELLGLTADDIKLDFGVGTG